VTTDIDSVKAQPVTFTKREEANVLEALEDGVAGCHANAVKLDSQSQSVDTSLILDRYAKDYPLGPHDQPQSMCPAFGSLRVGLRMKRTATILSGSACCVYGLTFTSHFYGAKRSVGYVPFNSETLVTGKLFEDIRDAVHKLADPKLYDTIIVTNLCVPTASGVPLRLLPEEINGVRIVGIDVPGFGVPTHAEAKDVLSGAMLAYARNEVLDGPVPAPAKPQQDTDSDRPGITLLGELFPADPLVIARLIEPLGLRVSGTAPVREWRELYTALDSVAVAALHPFYTASVREFERAGRPVFGSAPVGVEGTDAWLESLSATVGLKRTLVDQVKNDNLAQIRQAIENAPIKGRITLSGYEGSELIVARLLIESGADVRYVGTACPKTPFSTDDCNWLESRGVHVNFRASLEDDVYAMQQTNPDLAIGTTPVVQKAKELSIPSLYFTNMISARPLMGAAGAGALAQVINAAIAGRYRFERMTSFFDGVGTGEKAGVWSELPVERPAFKEQRRRRREKNAAARTVEEPI
jgi:chlorophyllide a reductase subunit Y